MGQGGEPHRAEPLALSRRHPCYTHACARFGCAQNADDGYLSKEERSKDLVYNSEMVKLCILVSGADVAAGAAPEEGGGFLATLVGDTKPHYAAKDVRRSPPPDGPCPIMRHAFDERLRRAAAIQDVQVRRQWAQDHQELLRPLR